MHDVHNAKNITSADASSNVLVSGKPGAVMFVTVNKTSAHALGIYDGTDITTLTNNRLLGTLKASVVEATYTYKIAVSKGIVISVPASYVGDVTVSYQ